MSDTSVRIDQINSLFEAYAQQEARKLKNLKYESSPLCFTALQANSTITLNTTASLEYCTDGKVWMTYVSPAQITLAHIGDIVLFRGDNDAIPRTGAYAMTLTGKFKVSGNIMSILGWKEVIEANGALQSFFGFCPQIVDVSELVLPAKKIGKDAYNGMFYGTGITSLPTIKAEQVGDGSFTRMFASCNSLEFVDVPVPKSSSITKNAANVVSYMFRECTGLKYVNFDVSNFISLPLSRSWYFARSLLEGCTGLKVVKVNFDDFYVDRHFVENWLRNAAQDATLLCPPNLDTSTRGNSTVPAGWTIVRGGNDWNRKTTCKADATETNSYMVCPGDVIPAITVSASLTLDAISLVPSTEIAYAEVVLDIASGATVTAGSNLTFVDEPTDGMRNICVVRWQDGAAKLYVTMTEELEESSSSAGE